MKKWFDKKVLPMMMSAGIMLMFLFMMNVCVFAEDISIDVSTKEELISAVSAINDETGGDHTINITDDIDMDNSSISFRNSTDEKTVTIIGNGNTLNNIKYNFIRKMA